MNVLVTHECSSIVAAAFRARGHNAYSNDIKPSTRKGWRYHLQMDWRKALEAFKCDLLIAHPVCTYLCNSGVGRLIHTPPNPTPGVLYGEARWAAMREAALHFKELDECDVKKKAIENPIMHGHAGIRKPDQTIQPNWFGDDASKRTALWLHNLKKLQPTRQVPPRMVCRECGAVKHPPLYLSPAECKCDPLCHWLPRWANQTDSGQNKLTPSDDRGALRAETYPGVADAMAEQWGIE